MRIDVEVIAPKVHHALLELVWTVGRPQDRGTLKFLDNSLTLDVHQLSALHAQAVQLAELEREIDRLLEIGLNLLVDISLVTQ